MTTGRILVTCATGKVGREVVAQLTASGAPFLAASSRPRAARELLDVDAGHLDWADPASWPPALAEVDRLYITFPYATSVTETIAQLEAFVDHAVERGVVRIVCMSALGIERHPDDPMARLERRVVASGVDYVLIRPNWFMQNFGTLFHESIRDDGILRIPADDHRVGFVDTRDIAEVVVRGLGVHSLEGRLASGSVLRLTGPEALTHAEVADLLSLVLDRAIRYESPSREDALETMREADVAGHLMRFYTWLYDDIHAGHNAHVTGDVEVALGRPPRSLRDYVAEHAPLWS